jgi:tripartite-type tricarboxylate transporter receptor subunit TctC
MRIKGYHLLPAAVLSAVLPFGSIAGAQDYPAKPVKIITQGAAGSGIAPAAVELAKEALPTLSR